MHPEHAADQRQRSGAGPAGERPASAADAGHEGVSGASRTHRELEQNLSGTTEWTVVLSVSSVFLKVEELDHLNIIHVTGTKGKVSTFWPQTRYRTSCSSTSSHVTVFNVHAHRKMSAVKAGFVFQGSTCAFTEQILRNYGFRTGFYR